LPAAFGLSSPRRGIASAADSGARTIALTDEYLGDHEIGSLHDAVLLIMCFILAIHWKDELAQLRGMPPLLVNDLATAMNKDMSAY
jgi:hypothetical protein